MSKERRADLIFGIVLVLIGGLFLASQFNLLPGLEKIFNVQFQWPWIIIGLGVVLFLLALLVRVPGLMVPAAINAGIGGLLWWTNSTGNWGDWSFLWTMIPGFVGIGIILAALLGGGGRSQYMDGLRLILISAILFILFLMLLYQQGYFLKYWPVLVILAGLWILVQTIFRRK